MIAERRAKNAEILRMPGAQDNCAGQMSLTLTLSRHRERELEEAELEETTGEGRYTKFLSAYPKF
jgi:hypothetical protein